MSRAIKFRAWVNGHWVDWLPNSKTLGDYNEVGIYADEYNTDSKCYIEQYTGLKDKNGKEIYEGDIMRFDAIDYEIYWSFDFSGWHNRRVDGEERFYGANSFEEVIKFGKVIGNIHENPELLEVKE